MLLDEAVTFNGPVFRVWGYSEGKLKEAVALVGTALQIRVYVPDQNEPLLILSHKAYDGSTFVAALAQHGWHELGSPALRPSEAHPESEGV